MLLVTPVLVAACVEAKVELNASAATAAIEMLKVRIAFLPMLQDGQYSPNANADTSVVVPAFKCA